jgi:hypothetical protein
VLINGPSASGPGFEVGFQTRPIGGFSVEGDFSWTGLKFDSIVYEAEVNSSGMGYYAPAIPKGGRLGDSPEFTAGLLGKYEFGLGLADWKAAMTASVNYTSDLVAYTATVPFYGNSVVFTRASLDFLAPAHWTVSLFVDNAANANPSTNPGDGIPQWNNRMPPRTAGLQVEYRMH